MEKPLKFAYLAPDRTLFCWEAKATVLRKKNILKWVTPDWGRLLIPTLKYTHAKEEKL